MKSKHTFIMLMRAVRHISVVMRIHIKLTTKKAPRGIHWRNISTVLRSTDVTSFFGPPAVCSASAWRHKTSVSIWYQEHQLIRVKPPHQEHLHQLSKLRNETISDQINRKQQVNTDVVRFRCRTVLKIRFGTSFPWCIISVWVTMVTYLQLTLLWWRCVSLVLCFLHERSRSRQNVLCV